MAQNAKGKALGEVQHGTGTISKIATKGRKCISYSIKSKLS